MIHYKLLLTYLLDVFLQSFDTVVLVATSR